MGGPPLLTGQADGDRLAIVGFRLRLPAELFADARQRLADPGILWLAAQGLFANGQGQIQLPLVAESLHLGSQGHDHPSASMATMAAAGPGRQAQKPWPAQSGL
ncbi:hypothetical protein WL1483_111 [Aeromonas schubertii]|uniref:Uncharacterized protein n=1 Tax=Aeromonas schubertii TaxID=652 RepID=A0A0S2SCX5_9GAMM|nr:hypothetical protein WL1483_111 [Aeromonas schubertii]